MTIASAGNGVDFGNLTAANLHNSGLSNSTKIWGEEGPSLTNIIEYVEINTTGNALDLVTYQVTLMQGQVILLLLLHLLGECLQVELTHLPLQVITLLGLPKVSLLPKEIQLNLS